MTETAAIAMPSPLDDDDAFDPIEARLRQNIRATIEALFEEELEAAIGRCRYGRGAGRKGYRHGHRSRQLVGTFGAETVQVPRARIQDADGGATEWRSRALPRYQRLTKTAEALITAVYLSGANTRRVKRALVALFRGAVGRGEPLMRHWFEHNGERQPRVAQDQGGLRRVVRPQPRRRGHRPGDPRVTRESW